MVLSVYTHSSIPDVIYTYLHPTDESVYEIAGELYYRVVRDTADRHGLTLMGVDASRERWINDIIDGRTEHHNVDTLWEALSHIRRWFGGSNRIVL